MAYDINRRTTFDRVAQRYEKARPGYPEPLFDEIIALSGIPDDGRILEVGCGTGKATRSFARRGYAMHCLELGANMAALAAHNCEPYPEVQIEVTSFEDWPLEKAAFDLVFAAQAFHWIPQEIAYSKSAAALKPGGTLALFWNLYPPMESSLRRELDAIYQRNVPELSSRATARTPAVMIEEIVNDFDDSGYFDPAVVEQFPWSATYSADRYVDLLSTYSDHISLPESTRQALLTDIRALIDANGGEIERPYLAVLICAQASPRAAGK